MMVLTIGQVMPEESPIPMWFDADPLIDYVLIPTDIDVLGGQRVAGERVMEDAWRRYVRIYFPKTRDDLVEGFEFLVFPDGYLRPFSPSQVEYMRFAVEASPVAPSSSPLVQARLVQRANCTCKVARARVILPAEPSS